MSSYFESVRVINFELKNVLTWGVVNSRVGYTVPISVSKDILVCLSDIAKENRTKSPVYGKYNTIYLKKDALTSNQECLLLNKGRTKVNVDFEVIGVNTSANGKRYLSFRVKKLDKVVRLYEVL